MDHVMRKPMLFPSMCILQITEIREGLQTTLDYSLVLSPCAPPVVNEVKFLGLITQKW